MKDGILNSIAALFYIGFVLIEEVLESEFMQYLNVPDEVAALVAAILLAASYRLFFGPAAAPIFLANRIELLCRKKPVTMQTSEPVPLRKPVQRVPEPTHPMEQKLSA